MNAKGLNIENSLESGIAFVQICIYEVIQMTGFDYYITFENRTEKNRTEGEKPKPNRTEKNPNHFSPNNDLVKLTGRPNSV